MRRIVLLGLCSFSTLWVNEIRAAGAVQPIATVEELGNHVTVASIEADPGIVAKELVTSLGDVNGDGLEDIAFLGGQDFGYILYGKTELPRTLDLTQWFDWGIRIRGGLLGGLSWPEAGLGDLDGDGFADTVFGGPEAHVLFGAPHFPVEIARDEMDELRGSTVLADGTVNGIEGTRSFTSFAAGDLNGDGIGDVVFGCDDAYRDGLPQGEGLVYLYFGRLPFPETIDLSAIVAKDGVGVRFHATSGAPLEPRFPPEFGRRVSSGQDFDADGVDDLVIAAPDWREDDGEGVMSPDFGGAIFVVFGRRTWPREFDVASPAATGVCRIHTTDENWNVGKHTLAAINDVTLDGIPDLLVSDSYRCCLISGAALAPGDFLLDAITTTIFVTSRKRETAGAEIGDWDGDGSPDLAMGSQSTALASFGMQRLGAVFLVSGRAAYPDPFLLDSTIPGVAAVVGPSEYSGFGTAVVGADVNGDGLSDVAVQAPRWHLAEKYPLWEVYVIPGGIDLVGDLEGHDYSPKVSVVSGGDQLIVYGRGFNEATELYIGGREAEIVERSNSRMITARIPPAETAHAATVELRRSVDSYTFAEPLVYYESLFPREVDVSAWGNQGRIIEEPNLYEPNYFCSFSQYFGGAGDFTGDGLSDLVVLIEKFGNDASEFFLLHGARNLPPLILTGDRSSWATTFTSAVEDGGFGTRAFLVGDMNGDGLSDLAFSTTNNSEVYVLFGGDVPKGRVVAQDLLAQGRGFRITDVPVISKTGYTIVPVGDFNGDSLADFCLLIDTLLDDSSRATFILGNRTPPSALSYTDLPKLFGKHHPEGSRIVALEGIGDVDGDGRDDIAFHAYSLGFGDGFSSEFIFFGRELGTGEELSLDAVTEDEMWHIFEESGSRNASIYGIGDHNGDGRDDLGIISQIWPAQSVGTTRIHILYGAPRGELRGLLDAAKDWEFDASFPATPGYNGYLKGLAGDRDFNGDGSPDILVSDDHRHREDGHPPPSRAIVIFGGDLEAKAAPLSELTESFALIKHQEYLTEDGGASSFPVKFDFAGDVNGDGEEDLVAYDRDRVYIYYNPLGPMVFGYPFVRGDANHDGAVNIADAIFVLQHLFANGPPILCQDAADANDDEAVNIADGIYILQNLFASGPPLPPPRQCGVDPEGDALDCRKKTCEIGGAGRKEKGRADGVQK